MHGGGGDAPGGDSDDEVDRVVGVCGQRMQIGPASRSAKGRGTGTLKSHRAHTWSGDNEDQRQSHMQDEVWRKWVWG